MLTNQARKQEKLLYVCFHVLLNLAEEAEIERKMSKKGIIGHLTAVLERDNPEIRVLVRMPSEARATSSMFNESAHTATQRALNQRSVSTSSEPY